jgi:hypothetical protein
MATFLDTKAAALKLVVVAARTLHQNNIRQ